jgi:hypothetical protein
MNAKIEAQAASMIRLIADRLPHMREEVADLINAGMSIAFSEGKITGIRESSAMVETVMATEKAGHA